MIFVPWKINISEVQDIHKQFSTYAKNIINVNFIYFIEPL